MRVVGEAELEEALDYPSLVERLRAAFRAGAEAPPRQQYALCGSGPEAGTLLVMPAWRAGGPLGVKLATVFPANARKGLSAVFASYLLLDGESGAPLALLDGTTLTKRRTGAASALAAGYLARKDSARLLMVGTGAMAPHLVLAHAAVRPIREAIVWGRTSESAERLARRLDRPGLRVRATRDLESAARAADIISCATLATEPLIRGEWLRPGAHLDLVGGFTPAMREADDEAIRRSRVFVDTREGALREAGDLVQPIAKGVLRREDVAGDLFELTRGTRSGRAHEAEITLFKSVGSALEDLAAAELVAERLR